MNDNDPIIESVSEEEEAALRMRAVEMGFLRVDLETG